MCVMPLRERLSSIQYMRGLAALSVMWFHLTRGVPDHYIKASGAYGYLGIAVFFVISGFVIPYSLAGSGYQLRDGGRFFLRRIIRLEPPFLAAVVIAVALYHLSAAMPDFRGKPWPTEAYDLSLHPAYLVPWFGGHWANPVFWTLAIEFQYYVAMFFLAPGLISTSPWANRIFLAATLALSFASGDPRLIFTYLPLFGFGFIAFLAMRGSLPQIELAAWSIATAIACATTLGLSFAAAGAAGCLALLIEWPAGIRALGFFGAISYSLYLLHVPIGGRVMNLAGHFSIAPMMTLIALLVATLLSLAGAWLLWIAIEQPSLKFAAYCQTPKRPVSSFRIAKSVPTNQASVPSIFPATPLA